MSNLGKVPLERALSKLGVASRTQTNELISKGQISVEGKVIRDPKFLVTPETARITVNGKLVVKSIWQTIMLNKPKGYVTTRSDEKGRQTVYDLLPEGLKHLHSVGRLDMATTGLLILTTDTKLSNFLTDPVNEFLRTYIVVVEGNVTVEDVVKLQAGIEDEGEMLKPKEVTLRKRSNKESHLTIKLTEGKNREVRRLMAAIGREVTELKRVSFGKLMLGQLLPGQYKTINKEDVL